MQRILTLREKTILYLAISVIIFSVIFNFLIIPVLKKNGALNKEIALTKTKLNKYTRLLTQKDLIQSKYNKFASRISPSLQDKGTLVSALSTLETLAQESGIRILDIRPQGSRDLELYKEILIDLKAEATLEGYLKFIYNIENSLSLLRIRRFQISAKPNTEVLEGKFSISQFSTQ